VNFLLLTKERKCMRTEVQLETICGFQDIFFVLDIHSIFSFFLRIYNEKPIICEVDFSANNS
jgi:hypothetical protein